MRRHTGVVIATAATALALTACTSPASPGTDPTSPTNPTTGGGEKVTLTFVTHYTEGPTKESFERLIAQWNGEHPDIEVVHQPVQFADLLTTLSTRQVGGQGADLFNAYSVWGQLASSGVLDTPPDSVANDIKSNYNATALAAVTGPDGEIFGYPGEVNTAAMYYNKQLLAAAGYDQPPATWAELEEIANAITKQDASGNYEVVGFPPTKTFDNDKNNVHPFLSLWNAAGATSLTNPDGTSALDDNATDLLEMYSRLVESGAMSIAIDPYTAFPNGQIGMFIELGWFLATLKDTMPAADFEAMVGTAPVPGPTAGQHGSVSAVYYMGVSAASAHKEQAWQFLEWMNTVTNSDGTTVLGSDYATNGFIPGRVADDEAFGAQVTADQPLLQPYWDAAGYAMAESNTPNGYAAKTALYDGISELVSRQTPVDQVVSQINSQIDASR
jgi:multiple sugar transport system substrate-binding protein